jgi:predicted RNase H-like HicB family nuclease
MRPTAWHGESYYKSRRMARKERTTKTYFAVADKDHCGAYGLWFPDVPGCFSASDREEDIVKNAMEALLLHLEGEEHPAARQVYEVACDPAVAQKLASGSYLISVPLVTAKHRSVRVNLSLDKGIVEAIDDAAQVRGLSRSAFMAEAAQNEIQGW